MKRMILSVALIIVSFVAIYAQNDDALKATVKKLEQASAVKDYEQLAAEFDQLATKQGSQWLPYYYAAFCNAKIGWLYQDDGDRIEPYADKADEQIKKAKALLDTAAQKKELAEVYTVLSMVNRARVYINPMTYGPKYGPSAGQYTQLARKIDPDNPRALYIEGWEKFATPKMWGGDKQKAKELLLAAQQQLTKNPADETAPHWGKKEVEELLKKIK